MDKKWIVPLAGVLFLVLAIIGFAVSGEPPDPEEGGAEIIEFYVDNEGAVLTGAIIQAIAATALVFFAGSLRRALRDAEGGNGILSAVAFGGLVIVATGIAIDATLSFALVDTAEEIEPVAAQALAALWNNDFVPMAVGTQVFLLATGFSALKHGALPKWIGVIAILLGIIAVTPIGFAAFIGSGILIAIIGGLLASRWRGEGASAPPAAPADSAA